MLWLDLAEANQQDEGSVRESVPPGAEILRLTEQGVTPCPEGTPTRWRPVLDAMARSVRHVGGPGAGATTKLIVNLALGAHRLVLAEALVLGERSGLDLPVLLDVLQDSAAYSKAMDGWGERMIAGDHDRPMSRIRQHAKDVGLILEAGQAVGAPLWVGATVAQVLAVAQAQGLSEADNSAVIAVLRRLAPHLRPADPPADASGASAPA